MKNQETQKLNILKEKLKFHNKMKYLKITQIQIKEK